MVALYLSLCLLLASPLRPAMPMSAARTFFLSESAWSGAAGSSYTNLTFLAYGDWGMRGDIQTSVALAMGEAASLYNANFVVGLGDSFYPGKPVTNRIDTVVGLMQPIETILYPTFS